MNEYQIKADFDYLIYVDNVANNHEKIIQEFYANDNFNHITLYVTKLNDKKTNYSIKILKNGKDIELVMIL